MKTNQIVLLGATAYTGRLIAKELKSADINFRIAGRDLASLLELQIELRISESPLICDLKKPLDIKNLLDETDLLINCVGPFNLLSKELLKEVAKRKIIYLDITGEQGFVHNSTEKLQGAALKNKALILHSCSFESFLADVLAYTCLTKKENYESIYSIYRFGKSRPSPGTRFTMQLAKHYPNYFVENCSLIETPPLAKTIAIQWENQKQSYACFVPYPEVIFFNKNFQTKHCGSFMAMEKEEIKLSHGNSPKPIEEIIKRHESSKHRGPSEKERKAQEFSLILFSKNKAGKIKALEMEGKDMYRITAQIITLLVKSFAKRSPRKYGVLAPSEVLNRKTILSELKTQLNISLSEIEGIQSIEELNSRDL